MKSYTRSLDAHYFPSFYFFIFFKSKSYFLDCRSQLVLMFFVSFAGIDLCMLRLEMTFKVEKAIHQSMKVMIRPGQ